MAERILRPLRLPVLPIFSLTALQHLAHPQALRGGSKADCTHFCPTPGGMFELWTQFLHNTLEVVLAYELEVAVKQAEMEGFVNTLPTVQPDML